MVNGGKTLEVNLHVEDQVAFTMPWNAVQHNDRVDQGPLTKYICPENNVNVGDIDSLPVTAKPDSCLRSRADAGIREDASRFRTTPRGPLNLSSGRLRAPARINHIGAFANRPWQQKERIFCEKGVGIAVQIGRAVVQLNVRCHAHIGKNIPSRVRHQPAGGHAGQVIVDRRGRFCASRLRMIKVYPRRADNSKPQYLPLPTPVVTTPLAFDRGIDIVLHPQEVASL